MKKNQAFSKLPSVDKILSNPRIEDLINCYPRKLILESIREKINQKREEIIFLDEKDIDSFDIKEEDLISDIINCVKDKFELSIKKVVNGTGVILHTNLGRSRLSPKIKDELINIAFGYSNLEYDLSEGQRGSRYDHLVEIIKELTGAEDVLVVNNNAAAVLLVLDTLARDGEIIVSRGELVEVGGSFRISSIMELGSGKLVEVGSTNKTHIRDYKKAFNENTKAIMKVHTSNYKILGFTESVEIDQLKQEEEFRELPIIEDLGSGVFIDLSKYGLSYEPTVIDSIKKGADVVTFSGDKMLGGPQAGIIVGKKKYIKKMKKNQLTRALRVDKMTIAALEATLRIYLDEKDAIENIPTLKMITCKLEELDKKADLLLHKILNLNIDAAVEKQKDVSQVGGGSMPLEKLDTYTIAIKPNKFSVSYLEKTLRNSESHIIGRINEDKYILDVRTIEENEFDFIIKELKKVFN
ncbi:L-seryl-tRNA(Sec) selenium transferase [Intestinibacter sp.]|uniref:L-seryl-tRNA(Sec) selenium transferase n=1 Tax=Intestinibacter sp. TaxID=1965304 RepID=UPI002A751E15|nr:L-seryl-tRNA(Sec) selenium transferase [Intestinibacter sp.]MDY2737355.1 L-seryl-tRNA(Sec) selenium transferase [Intestinibacter sp.]MDY4575045.1 L-seryl-tRNA(Sec) selenium transferase [Intestinibacter sp.]